LFAVIAYRAAPEAVLPAHNHPNYSVATVGIAGEALVSQFEVEGQAPPFEAATTFQVRKTTERVLRMGDAVTLSPAYDNIYTFRVGPQGAVWIDVTAPLRIPARVRRARRASA
jgi:hypothetical protein